MDPSKDGKRSYSCRSALSKKLVPFLNREELTDIHVKVGQRTFAAHRLVLGSWSDELANLIMTASDNVIELAQNATDKEIEVFETVLNFLYTGEMNFSSGNVRMVMSLANRLGLKKLGDMAQDWVGDMINQGSMVGAITWLRDTDEYDYVSLKNDCLRTLSLYFQYIPEASWLGLSRKELCSILERRDLVVDNELEVITRVDDWLKAKGSIEDNKDLYLEIVPKIRFPLVETSKLLHLQEASPIVKFATEYFPLILSDSFKYRALSSELGLTISDADRRSSHLQESYAFLKKSDFQPRLYLDFVPPGKVSSSQYSQRPQRQNGCFEEISFDSYKTEMKCVVKDATGAWSLETRSRFFNFALRLEPIQVGDTEAWGVRYEITSSKSYQSNANYVMVLVTRPQDKDSDFYLPENPIVMTKQGSLSKLSGISPSDTISVSTRPIFAGRKPKKVEVAAIVYMKMTE